MIKSQAVLNGMEKMAQNECKQKLNGKLSSLSSIPLVFLTKSFPLTLYFNSFSFELTVGLTNTELSLYGGGILSLMPSFGGNDCDRLWP